MHGLNIFSLLSLMSMHKLLEPKIFSVLKEGYNFQKFSGDLTAGLVVGILALPLSLAFAISSGLKPEQGLYTAIIAGLIIAIFGGSRVQVSGPTGAFIVVIYGIVEQYGYNGLALATFMAGLMLIAAGFSGMGLLLRFIPYPLTVGFTSGIALIIFSSQIKDLLGLEIDKLPADFINKWESIFSNLLTVNIAAVLISLLALVIIFVTPRFTRRLPGSIIAILVCSLIVHFFKLDVETITSRFNGVPSSLPAFRPLDLSLESVQQMFRPAVTIALLGGIESLLSAVVADGMMQTKHRSNMELIAQGLGNVVVPFFGGFAATGAIARTATNIKNGATTPLAAIIHCLVLLLILLFLGPLAGEIPLCVLAAVLVYVSYNMSEWHSFLRIFKYPRSDRIVLIITFLLTVLIDLTVAIEVGVLLSAFLFLRKMSDLTEVMLIRHELALEREDGEEHARIKLPEGVEIFALSGAIFYSSIERFQTALVRRLDKPPKKLILDCSEVITIDGSGLQALEQLIRNIHKTGGDVVLAGAHGETLKIIQKAGIFKENQIFSKVEDCLDKA